MDRRNWIELSQDADTGIESIRAHFQGHAYDPHWHDSFLVGVTEQGVQQFNCRRVRHLSTPGKVFMLKPGEIHDGHAPTEEGFTYSMLYLDPHWLERELHALFEHAPTNSQPGFADTLSQDPRLATAIFQAFHALHDGDLRIVRQSAIDTLLGSLTCHLDWRKRQTFDPRLPLVAQVARDYLHAHVYEDIGLDDLAHACGVDRFRLTRAFKAAFGLAPHAYLIQLRLAKARQLLARGESPAQVASALGFADQSHMGRWFRRAYQLTPADYRKRCRLNSADSRSWFLIDLGVHAMESLLPFLLFAFVASITPGPTNILVLSHSSRRGLGATLPIIFGACVAAALIVFAVGLGVGETLLRFPRVQQAMAWVGVLWLSWLAWQIFQSSPPSLKPTTSRDEGLSVFGAATLQLINPKVWMMAVAVASVFVGGGDKTLRLVVLSLMFLLVSLPCMTLWALLGVGSARAFGSPQAFKRMNTALAFLLLVSAWLTVLV